MEKIGMALARLERVKELLKNWQQKKAVSNIERNIVLSQLAALYDELLDLGISGSKSAEVAPNKVEETKSEEQQVTLAAAENMVVEKESEPIIIAQTPPVQNSNVAESKEKEVAPVVKQEEKDDTVRLGDKFVGIHKYLYDSFEHQDESSVARFSAIDDINRAIGINDRFLFIKELFNGDKDLFSKVISTLNSCGSLDDALVYIHENFSWNSENPAVKQLVLLLYRRFK